MYRYSFIEGGFLMGIFWVTTGITISLFIIFFSIIYQILRKEKWSLKRALSEPIRGKDYEPMTMNSATDEPILIESSSRLIALVGLAAILAIDLGVAVMIFYSTLVHTSGNLNLTTIGGFLIAQAGIFAPYVANQIRSAAVGAGSKTS
jgi:hypothetical protein